MQQYIHSDNPAPDEDTLLTLIETNDQLATAMSRHQRALLQARRLTGAAAPSPVGNSNGPFEAPAEPPAGAQLAQFAPPPGPPPRKQSAQNNASDPFADDHEAEGPGGNLRAPLVPQNYGLPPMGIMNSPVANTNVDRSLENASNEPQQQSAPTKPRYRF